MREHNADFCRPHTELLDDHRRAQDQQGTSFEPGGPVDRDGLKNGDADKLSSPMPSAEAQADLVRRLMESVTKLEDQARRLLLDNLEQGLARTLLVADRNCQ